LWPRLNILYRIFPSHAKLMPSSTNPLEPFAKFHFAESLCCRQLDINCARLAVRSRANFSKNQQAGKELRIIFAMTLALGVSSPTVTTNSSNGINPGSFEIASAVSPSETLRMLKLASLTPSDDTSVVINDGAEPRETAKEDPVADQDDDPPVTVPIERVCEALAQAASDQGLPIGFFARLIWQESKFDQWARSGAGARGVAQFMPLTAAEYGLHDPFDPLRSVAASARFLRELRDQFGNLGLAAAAYNAGGGRIRKWLNGQLSLPEETRNYVQSITGHPLTRWIVQKPLQVSFALPGRAPCDGVDGLSRQVEAKSHEVRLTGLSVELIAQAEAARRAKIAAERAARKKQLAAKAAKARKFARKHGVEVASAK